MEEFIQLACRQIGIGEGTARSATGGLLKFIKDQGGAADSESLLSSLPGSDALVTDAQASTSGGAAGMLGGLGSMLGGNFATAAGAIGLVQQLGLDADKLGPFVGMFVAFVKEKAGADVIERVLANIPELKKLSG